MGWQEYAVLRRKALCNPAWRPFRLKQRGQWVRQGKVKYFERTAEGIENAPRAFIEMLRGESIGKQIVELGAE